MVLLLFTDEKELHETSGQDGRENEPYKTTVQDGRKKELHKTSLKNGRHQQTNECIIDGLTPMHTFL